MSNFSFQLHLQGQCTSGKNAVIVTRTGHRFPSGRFVKWRADAMEQLHSQIDIIKREQVKLPFNFPVNVEITYIAKDRIRRDVPGIIDALWHLLEKCNIVTDDTFLGGYDKELLFHNQGVDKKHAGVIISIWGDYASTTPLYKKQSKTGIKRKPRRVSRRTS